MYDQIVNCLNNGSKSFCQKRAKQHKFRPGWNEYVSELHVEAKEAFKNWVLSGKARHGPESEQKKHANTKFKYAVRFIRRNEALNVVNKVRYLGHIIRNDLRDDDDVVSFMFKEQ